MSQARDVQRDLLRVEGQVRRAGGVGGEAAAGAGEENGKLKRLLADAMLDNAGGGAAVKKMVTPAARREAVAHSQGLLKVSEPRAYRIVGADRKSIRHRSRCRDDADLRERLRDLARERRRFGGSAVRRFGGSAVRRFGGNVIPIGNVVNKGITIRADQASVKRLLPLLIDHIQAGRLNPKEIITHRIPVQEISDAHHISAAKLDGCIKPLVVLDAV